ncbi:MAG: 50S ribosomal protein L11 [Candidatus Pacebacteria bacterium]|jgi:large subunit ribosomal protein L11|nr:50S ribosomal protein L11 [Candidatus Paceibacterota bacterium]
MAKKVTKVLKLQIQAGKANPAPPLGPALGQAGVNIGTFVNDFNGKTREMEGTIAIVMTVFDDRSFEYVIKTPPVTSLILKAAGVEKGSGKNTAKKAGSITKAQVKEIAEIKLPDLSANTVEAAMKIVEGSCRSMGIEVK